MSLVTCILRLHSTCAVHRSRIYNGDMKLMLVCVGTGKTVSMIKLIVSSLPGTVIDRARRAAAIRTALAQRYTAFHAQKKCVRSLSATLSVHTTLVICPNSICSQWRDSIALFTASTLTCLVAQHTVRMTRRELCNASHCDVIIIARKLLESAYHKLDSQSKKTRRSERHTSHINDVVDVDADDDTDGCNDHSSHIADDVSNDDIDEYYDEYDCFLFLLHFHRLVVDESHLFSDFVSTPKEAKVLPHINSKNRWIMSGTHYAHKTSYTHTYINIHRYTRTHMRVNRSNVLVVYCVGTPVRSVGIEDFLNLCIMIGVEPYFMQAKAGDYEDARTFWDDMNGKNA